MEIFSILTEQIALFVIYMLVGVLMVKTQVLNKTTLETISRFVIKLSMPVMIFINTVNGVDRTTLFSSASVLGITVLLYVLLFLLTRLLAVFFRIRKDTVQLYQAVSMFGNVGFMGIPIVTSIFPEKGMLYISLFTIIDQLTLWTLGVKLTTPSGNGEPFNPKKLINPATAAIILALIFILGQIPVPGVLNQALTKIGATSTPLAMIYLGGVFCCMNIRDYIGKLEFYGTVLIKMVLFPILFFCLLEPFPISQDIRLTMALISALPTMSSVVMLAKASGADGDYAAGPIFVTTICSIITLPAVSLLFGFLS